MANIPSLKLSLVYVFSMFCSGFGQYYQQQPGQSAGGYGQYGSRYYGQASVGQSASAASYYAYGTQQQQYSGRWGKWSAWICTEECVGSVKATRKRRCTNNYSGTTCAPDANGISGVQTQPCAGVCKKEWVMWGDWSECTATCEAPDRVRHRRCEGFGIPCVGVAQEFSQCQDPLRQQFCPLVDGGWSRWSDWAVECSVTCGYNGVRARTRVCNNPPPTKRGRVCEGDTMQGLPCSVDVICPIHGNWTEWSEWTCSVLCAGGQGNRTRECDNPAPAYGGNFCRGNTTMSGACNTFTCPPAHMITLSPEIMAAVQRHLESIHYNYEKREHETAFLPCRSNVTDMIYAAYPESTLLWSRNGQPLHVDMLRMHFQLGDIKITDLLANDTGVYVCQVEFYPNITQVVSIVALSVMTMEAGISTRATFDTELECNSVAFGVIFNDMNQKWFHNDTIYKNYETTPPQMVSREQMKMVKEEDTGVWRCTVTHTPTGRTWTTNYLYMKVAPAPTMLEKLLGDPIFLAGVSCAIVFIVLMVASYCHQQKKKSAQLMKDQLEFLGLQAATPDNDLPMTSADYGPPRLMRLTASGNPIDPCDSENERTSICERPVKLTGDEDDKCTDEEEEEEEEEEKQERGDEEEKQERAEEEEGEAAERWDGAQCIP